MYTISIFKAPPVPVSLIKHKEGFYVQSAISTDDFNKAMDIALEARNAEVDSKEQITLHYTAADKYHFFFSLKSLFEKFKKFSQASEEASGYIRLKQLLEWCFPNINLDTRDDLIQSATMFVKKLSYSFCFNGTPGFLRAYAFYTQLASFIGHMPKLSETDVTRDTFLISDLYKTCVELMFAAKLTRDYSKAEILNCDTDAEIELFNNAELCHQKILDFYNDYYCYFNKKYNLEILDIQILKQNGSYLAKIFFDNFIQSKPDEIVPNNSVLSSPKK